MILGLTLFAADYHVSILMCRLVSLFIVTGVLLPVLDRLWQLQSSFATPFTSLCLASMVCGFGFFTLPFPDPATDPAGAARPSKKERLRARFVLDLGKSRKFRKVQQDAIMGPTTPRPPTSILSPGSGVSRMATPVFQAEVPSGSGRIPAAEQSSVRLLVEIPQAKDAVDTRTFLDLSPDVLLLPESLQLPVGARQLWRRA